MGSQPEKPRRVLRCVPHIVATRMRHCRVSMHSSWITNGAVGLGAECLAEADVEKCVSDIWPDFLEFLLSSASFTVS
eukprot:16169481-Heterocapsa_arctica.AAC.1